jgi:hypothetical protein
VLPQRRRVQARVGVRVVLQRMRVRVRTRVRVRVGLQGQRLGAQTRNLSSVHLTLRGEVRAIARATSVRPSVNRGESEGEAKPRRGEGCRWSDLGPCQSQPLSWQSASVMMAVTLSLDPQD